MKQHGYIHILQTIVLLFSFLSLTQAQGMKGRITNEKNEPVVSASLYIKELRQGTTANEEGDYELKIPAGNYTCIFQSMGYETATHNVTIGQGVTLLNIVLKEKIYEIREVVISNKREDPAYNIMRRAIAMAPYYMNQVKEYDAELYLKGSVHVVKISAVVKRMAKKELEGIKEGNTYTEESVNEIKFTAPNKYKQKVLKKTGNLPEKQEVADALQMITVSVYDATAVLPYISPLSTSAFAHYRFAYEGFSEENGRMIYKIRITPSHKGKQLFSGYIYIADNFWNVHNMDLSGEFVIGGKFRVQINFGEVGENVWLPVSHRIDFAGSILGNKGDFRYISSLKYNNIAENTALRKPDAFKLAEQQRQTAQTEAAPSPTPSPAKKTAQNKNNKKIEKILSQEDLSNRDAYRLAKLMQKSAENEKPKEKSLNLTDSYYEDYKVEVDSNARQSDTAYWAKIRPVPLMADELKAYRQEWKPIKKDSTKKGLKPPINPDMTLRTPTNNAWRGGTLSLGKAGTLKYPGLKPSKAGFNTVDGFYIGQKITCYRDFAAKANEKRFSITPEVVWAINRKALMWNVSTELTYSPLHRGYASLSAGRQTTDFAGQKGTHPFDNTVASLFFRRNHLKLYDNQFIKASNTVDIANGLQLYTDLLYEKRTFCDNISDYSFFYNKKRDYSPNLPPNEAITAQIPAHQHLSFTINLSYTPRQYYRIGRDNRKRMMRSDFPTFAASWQKGMALWGSSSDYDQISLSLSQNISTGVMQHFNYQIRGGKFVNRRQLYFPDFRHFSTMEIATVRSSELSRFSLLDFYRYSTGSGFVEAHAHFSTPYLALKFLPFFNNRLFNESLQVNYLYTPEMKHYTELGYSLDLLMRIGIFAGFENLHFKHIGASICLPLTMLWNL
ncbi:MAG: DUF5686 and carboxypeptidase regulatory-like domain-containing protein [Bacteroidales bacterium]|jgi:hypothetical protein|nr:DUF5686 and carboxypeptidase regulatory-like domain-containing protein [Bacteroidales bacterium]